MNKFTRSLVVLAFSMMGLTGYADIWNGSGDISWYSESNSEFHIKRAAQLKGLFDLVKAGNSFDGKTIFLEDDLNMAYRDWFPIGGNYFGGVAFNGIFDGQNHKIESLHPVADTSSSYPIRCYGLFGDVGDQSVLKNIVISGGIDVIPQSQDFLVYAGGLVGNSSGKIANIHSRFNISAGSPSYSNPESMLVGGVCGQGNEIKEVSASGDISFAFANIYWRTNHCWIGGVAGKGTEINVAYSDCNISSWANSKEEYVAGIVAQMGDGAVRNACFYGSLHVKEDYYVSGSTSLYTACSGILGTGNGATTVSCCISAPQTFETGYTGYWISPIIGDNSSYSYDGGNNYYTIPTGYSNVLGNQIDESTLMSATSLPGFDSNIWDFSSNGKPMLKALKVKYCVSVRLDKGLIGYVVSDGGDLNLKLMTDAGYAVSKVYFNDTDVTDCLQGQDLNLTNITSSGELKFIFTQDASAVKMIENNTKPSFSITGKNLVFDDVTVETPLRVYNAEGRLVCSMKVNSNQSVPLNSGIYIVKLGKYTYKVSI